MHPTAEEAIQLIKELEQASEVESIEEVHAFCEIVLEALGESE